MFDSAPIDENVSMTIETDYYNSLFDGRLCPGQKDSEARKGKSYPFQHMWELFVYAAILGFTKGVSKPIQKPYRPFRWFNIKNDHQKNLLIMAVAKFGSLELLQHKDELRKTIEEHANGGLSLIDMEIKNNPSAFAGLDILTFKELNEIKSSIS